ncbi:small integral membrane protein 24 [Lissotriton helveticus]
MASTYPLLMALVLLASAEAQQANRATAPTRVLQPWLVGLTAVVVFLFIVFVLMIINRVWCKKKRHEEPMISRAGENAYDNNAMELGEDGERKELSKAGENVYHNDAMKLGEDGERLNEAKLKDAPVKVKWQTDGNPEEGEKITSM